MNWFSQRYHIEKKILEFNEKGWHKYVIGEFENENEALEYIKLKLHSKGLQHPFPRIMPDSLKQYSEKGKEPILAIKAPVQESRLDRLTNSDSARNVPSVQPVALQVKRLQTKRLNNEKYGPWGRMIRGKHLHTIEMLVVDKIKPILPGSWVPFYARMVDRAIRFPVILFFFMLIILFILNALLLMIFLEMSNTLKNRIERFDQLYRNMYERALTGYIFQEYDMEVAIQRIKKIHHTRNRKIFVTVLFNFQKNLSGDLDQKILDIYYRLGLHEDAIKRTRSKSFYHQILALSELTNLYPSAAFSIVNSHINDKNNELRAEAQTSYVRLHPDEPFRFLMDLRKPFTPWTQLTSFYIFKLHKLSAPSFGQYLNSNLYNVQNFSLRMIVHFQQKENAEEIIKLLNADREKTRFLAIKAINELGIREAKPKLKEAYGKETSRNRLEIVKSLLHIGNVEDFDFLERIIRQNDVSLKIEACRSMYFMNSEGMDNLIRLGLEKELNIEPYIAHIYDQRN
ncbi:MAG TPA: HEAT repeat domain-containing protein [Prolixibacteraceae bacterium]